MTSYCFQFAEHGVCRFGESCKFPHISVNANVGTSVPTGRKRRGGRRKPAFLEGFFAQYPEFDFDNTASASDEFYRMCDFFDWSRQDPDRETARAEYRTALTQQFNSNYGTDVDDLASWQHLCRVIGLYPVPDDMVTARSMVKSTFVNIVDLTDVPSTGQSATIFDTEMELSVYTKATGKIFPLDEAIAGGLLRYLLRNIMNPSAAPRRKARRNRR